MESTKTIYDIAKEAAYVIEQELTRRGYTCITLSTRPDPGRKAECIRILEQRWAEGAALMGSMFGTESVEESIREHLPHVPIAMAAGWICPMCMPSLLTKHTA